MNNLHSILVEQSETELMFTQILNAPRELIFTTFSESEHIKQWWGPQGWLMPVCKIDFRQGGEWLYSIRNTQGEEHWARAEYTEIVSPERIVFTDEMIDAQGNVLEGLPAKHVTIMFEELHKQTKLTVHVKLKSIEDRDKLVRMGFLQGFQQALHNLDKLVYSLQSNNA